MRACNSFTDRIVGTRRKVSAPTGAERSLYMKKLVHIGSLAVVLAALLWSLDGLLRLKLYTLPAPVVVFWEHLLGLAVLAFVVAESWRKFQKLTKKQWVAIAFVALLSGALGTILYTAALGQVMYIPFSVVVLLQQLNPVFAVVTAALLLKEKLDKRFLVLAILALIGAYFVTFPSLTVNLATGSGTVLAALMAVGAAASWGVGTAFSKYALKGTSYLHISTLRFAFTVVFALLFVIATGSAASLGALTWEQFGYLVAITFSTGMVALLIYYYGLQKVEASKASILELAWPLSSVVIGWLFLHQGLTWTQAIGAVLLLGTTYTLAQSDKSATDGKDILG